MKNNKTGSTNRGNINLASLVVFVGVIAIGIWLYIQNDSKTSVSEVATIASTESPTANSPQPLPPEVEAAPDIPMLVNNEESDVDVEQLLPPLAESDEFVRTLLSALSDQEEFQLWLQTDNLLQKSAAVVDGLSRGNLLRKIIPIQPPSGQFMAVHEGETIWLGEDNFARYNNYVDLLTSLPADLLVAIFHDLRPLFEKAFSQLGNDQDKLDNSLIATLDKIIATPEVPLPIALKHESVAYQFADPALEALPDIQKQVLRMGPDNTLKLKTYLQQIRSKLLATEENQG